MSVTFNPPSAESVAQSYKPEKVNELRLYVCSLTKPLWIDKVFSIVAPILLGILPLLLLSASELQPITLATKVTVLICSIAVLGIYSWVIQMISTRNGEYLAAERLKPFLRSNLLIERII